ncbi:MAG: hypothetical protein J6S23_04905 [Clostridia bacterium]|nr:hypothetical protein [Clostridia bacterium]
MDALILSLTPIQHQKYLELLGKDEISLDFEVGTIEFDNYSDENIKSAKSKIVAECEKLMNFEKSDSFFSAKLNNEEIEELIPIYFEVINEISKAKKELYSEAIAISSKIKDVEKAHIEISQKYSDFLPYKAAFGKNEKYQDEILRIDNDFKCEIEKALEQKKELSNELSRISTICDVLIPTFSKKSSRAADTPRFKRFNDKEFFAAVSSFMEQIKNI